jgi:hypothetical protein
MTLWTRIKALFSPPPQPSVDEHFDRMVDDWSSPRQETIQAAAIHLADLRAGRRPAEPVPTPPGLYRAQLRTRNGDLTGWIRATPSQANQARAAELPLLPEADFPLEVVA